MKLEQEREALRGSFDTIFHLPSNYGQDSDHPFTVIKRDFDENISRLFSEQAQFSIGDEERALIDLHIQLYGETQSNQRENNKTMRSTALHRSPCLNQSPHLALYYAAAGYTGLQTAGILKKSEHTVRHQLKDARMSIDTSLVQDAVAKAIDCRAIEPRLITSTIDLVGFYRLSDREREVYELISNFKTGYTNTQIAEKIFVTEQTVKNHINSLFRKVGVKNKLELAMYELVRRDHIVSRKGEGNKIISNEAKNYVIRLRTLDISPEKPLSRSSQAFKQNRELYEWFDSVSHSQTLAHAIFYGYIPQSFIAPPESFTAVRKLTPNERIILHKYGSYPDNLNPEQRAIQMNLDPEELRRDLLEIRKKLGCDTDTQAAALMAYIQLKGYESQTSTGKKHEKALRHHLTHPIKEVVQEDDETVQEEIEQLNMEPEVQKLIEAHVSIYQKKQVQRETSQRANETRFPHLTSTQHRTLYYIAAAYSNEQIAKILRVSLQTVEDTVTNIFENMETQSRQDTLTRALALGIINPLLTSDEINPPGYCLLRGQERQVYDHITNLEAGYTNKEIADKLLISEQRLENHIVTLSRKLNLMKKPGEEKMIDIIRHELGRRLYIMGRKDEGNSPTAEAEQRVRELKRSSIHNSQPNELTYQWFDAINYSEAMAHAAFYGFIPLSEIASERSLKAVNKLSAVEKMFLHAYSTYRDTIHPTERARRMGITLDELRQKLTVIQDKLGYNNTQQAATILTYMELKRHERWITRQRKRIEIWHKLSQEPQEPEQSGVIYQAAGE